MHCVPKDRVTKFLLEKVEKETKNFRHSTTRWLALTMLRPTQARPRSRKPTQRATVAGCCYNLLNLLLVVCRDWRPWDRASGLSGNLQPSEYQPVKCFWGDGRTKATQRSSRWVYSQKPLSENRLSCVSQTSPPPRASNSEFRTSENLHLYNSESR